RREEIREVMVESGRIGDLAHTAEVAMFEIAEAHDDVRHLNPEVVDVVLDFDRRPPEPEHAREGVAERGIAEMTDVRRLVRIDSGVLDDGLLGSGRGGGDLGANTRHT